MHYEEIWAEFWRFVAVCTGTYIKVYIAASWTALNVWIRRDELKNRLFFNSGTPFLFTTTNYIRNNRGHKERGTWHLKDQLLSARNDSDDQERERCRKKDAQQEDHEI